MKPPEKTLPMALRNTAVEPLLHDYSHLLLPYACRPGGLPSAAVRRRWRSSRGRRTRAMLLTPRSCCPARLPRKPAPPAMRSQGTASRSSEAIAMATLCWRTPAVRGWRACRSVRSTRAGSRCSAGSNSQTASASCSWSPAILRRQATVCWPHAPAADSTFSAASPRERCCREGQ